VCLFTVVVALCCVVGFRFSLLCFFIARPNSCAFYRCWPGKHWYLRVLRFDGFQLRSTNFRRPLHHTLHTIGFLVLSPSIHHQLLRLPVFMRRSVHSTRQRLMPCTLISTTSRDQHQSHAVVILPLILCNKFYIFCIYFVCGWVLVSLAEPVMV
jgi:hypothetical protein